MTTTTDLPFTIMFEPRMKSGGAGDVNEPGRGTVYEVLPVAAAAAGATATGAVLRFPWIQNSSSAKLSRNTFQSCQIHRCHHDTNKQCGTV